MKKTKELSLKKLLYKMAILYWIVPILLILLSLSFYSNFKIKSGFLDEITITINSAVELSEQNLSFLIQESKKATYEEIIEEAYLDYVENDDFVDLYKTTTNYLKNSYQYNSYITETILIYHEIENEIFYVNGNNSDLSFAQIKNFTNNNVEYLMELSYDIGTYFTFAVIDDELYLIRNLVKSSFEPFALLIFKINTDEIFYSLSNLPFSVGSSLIIGENTFDITSTDSNLWDYTYNPSENILEISSSYYLYENSFSVDYVDCQYRVLIDTELLRQDYLNMFLLVILVIVLIIPLIIIASKMFFKYFSVPFHTLVFASKKIEQGYIGYQIKKVPESVEFAYLFNRFNDMSYSMQEQIELIYKEQEALQNAKIKALQSQINPHFLNNTLEVINWEMRLGENQKAINMIESLSTMLGASMSRNEQQLKSLKEEFIYVNAYLYIVKTRMGKRLEIIQEIDEDIMEYKVPLLILQPIIENAIEHGIANRTFGVITIRVYGDDNNVFIEVENDNELKEKDKNRIEQLLNWTGQAEEGHIGHSSLGIRNVNERIKLIFGEEYSLTITSTENNGTLSRIILPKE